MDGLNTVLEYLTSVPAWYLATSVDGQPHVRPFSFAQIQDGKLWFVTARTKTCGKSCCKINALRPRVGGRAMVGSSCAGVRVWMTSRSRYARGRLEAPGAPRRALRGRRRSHARLL